MESDLGAGSAAAWSPDGTQIAFLAGGMGVFVMNADGGAHRLLHAGDDRQPVWSPDGSRVAFVQAQQNGGSLVVVEVASGDPRVVASPAVQGAWPPSWSPDGTRIAFTEGPSDLAVVGPDGSGHRVLVGGTGLEVGPAWSPDGTKIAFMHGPTVALPALHVVDADGGSLRRVAHTASYVFNLPGTPVPAWSPDGTRIAFTGTTIVGYSRYGPTYANDVYVVDAEGTLERRLTSGGGSSSATWSPDGRRIAFNGVYVMNPDGTCKTKIGSRAGHSPSWQTVADAPAAPLLLCADLELIVHGERGSVAAGGEESFSIAVRNLENMPATGVRLQAESPAGGSFVSATPDRGTCSLQNGALACELGALRVGEVVGVKVLARAAGVGIFSSTMRATATEPDGYQANNAGQLRFDALPCTIVGGASGSIVIGTRGPDTICTLYGSDVIHGLAGADSIDAGAGPDRVFPGRGRDSVMLRAGADFLDARTASATRSSAAASATSSSPIRSTASAAAASSSPGRRSAAARRSARVAPTGSWARRAAIPSARCPATTRSTRSPEPTPSMPEAGTTRSSAGGAGISSSAERATTGSSPVTARAIASAAARSSTPW